MLHPWIIAYVCIGIGLRGGYPHWGRVVRSLYTITFPLHAAGFWIIGNRRPLWFRTCGVFSTVWVFARPLLVLSVLWRLLCGSWPWELLGFGSLLPW